MSMVAFAARQLDDALAKRDKTQRAMAVVHDTLSQRLRSVRMLTELIVRTPPAQRDSLLERRSALCADSASTLELCDRLMSDLSMLSARIASIGAWQRSQRALARAAPHHMRLADYARAIRQSAGHLRLGARKQPTLCPGCDSPSSCRNCETMVAACELGDSLVRVIRTETHAARLVGASFAHLGVGQPVKALLSGELRAAAARHLSSRYPCTVCNRGFSTETLLADHQKSSCVLLTAALLIVRIRADRLPDERGQLSASALRARLASLNDECGPLPRSSDWMLEPHATASLACESSLFERAPYSFYAAIRNTPPPPQHNDGDYENNDEEDENKEEEKEEEEMCVVAKVVPAKRPIDGVGMMAKDFGVQEIDVMSLDGSRVSSAWEATESQAVALRQLAAPNRLRGLVVRRGKRPGAWM